MKTFTKIYLSTDHAGFELCNFVLDSLKNTSYNVEYLGPKTFDKDDDYPVYIKQIANVVGNDNTSLGIVFGGSGVGEAIVANKTKGVRCSLYYGKSKPITSIDIEENQSENPYEIIKLSRLHNNANMLSIGARFVDKEEAMEVIKIFLETEFQNIDRHIRRISEIE